MQSGKGSDRRTGKSWFSRRWFTPVTIRPGHGTANTRAWVGKTHDFVTAMPKSNRKVKGLALKITAVVAGLVAIGSRLFVEYFGQQRLDLGAASVLGLLVLAIVSLFVGYNMTDLRRYADRLLLRPGSKVLQADPRPVILLLRTFMDDYTVVPGKDNGKTLEECLCDKFRKLGPVVAIGRPNEELPPLGAARFWVDDSQWRNIIEEIAQEAQYIVLIMGQIQPLHRQGSGLHWEIGRVLEDDLREKVILVVPPVSDDTLRDRWAQYRELSGNHLPEFKGGEIYAVARGPATFEIGRANFLVKVRLYEMYAVCLKVAAKSLLRFRVQQLMARLWPLSGRGEERASE
jgi:hypothetical protein